jgi:DNA-binding CsgD family transcriptional regulator
VTAAEDAATKAARVEQAISKLSDRELAVLRLIAEGKENMSSD